MAKTRQNSSSLALPLTALGQNHAAHLLITRNHCSFGKCHIGMCKKDRTKFIWSLQQGSSSRQVGVFEAMCDPPRGPMLLGELGILSSWIQHWWVEPTHQPSARSLTSTSLPMWSYMLMFEQGWTISNNYPSCMYIYIYILKVYLCIYIYTYIDIYILKVYLCKYIYIYIHLNMAETLFKWWIRCPAFSARRLWTSAALARRSCKSCVECGQMGPLGYAQWSSSHHPFVHRFSILNHTLKWIFHSKPYIHTLRVPSFVEAPQIHRTTIHSWNHCIVVQNVNQQLLLRWPMLDVPFPPSNFQHTKGKQQRGFDSVPVKSWAIFQRGEFEWLAKSQRSASQSSRPECWSCPQDEFHPSS